MNKNLNPDAIRQSLNGSLAQLDEDTLARLRAARQHALQRASDRARSPVRTWIGKHVYGSAFVLRHAAAAKFATILLVIGLASGLGYYWEQIYDNSDEADIAILTDELPINYYVN